jgi:hypothetical protein
MPARMDIRFNGMPARIKWGAILSAGETTKGGKARMSSMSPDELTQFQSKAAKARWSKERKTNGLRSVQRSVISTHAGVAKPLPYGFEIESQQHGTR